MKQQQQANPKSKSSNPKRCSRLTYVEYVCHTEVWSIENKMIPIVIYY